MERSLDAWINQARIGTLRENNGLWAFRYSANWLTDPAAYPLCPLLPLQAEEHRDGASHRPVQWYFDNLLPEEGQRTLLAAAAGVTMADAFALLQHFGAESAGSITLLPPGDVPPPGRVQPLAVTTLSQRIQSMPEVPLAQRAAKRMSLAGAQHKMAVIYRDGQLLEPVGSEPSTHILKPDHPGADWRHSVINEWFVMTLAARVGLPVPTVERLYVPEPIFLIERFDRALDEAKSAEHYARLHCIDACQMDGLSREFKYTAGSIERLADLANRCKPAALARLRLFEWLVFNVLVGNEDAHLKNISFLLTAKGVRLAPFYDLLCTAVYGTKACNKDRWPEQAELAWPILGRQRLPQIDADLLIQAGQAMGIKPATAKSAVRKLVDALSSAAPLLLDDVLAENTRLGRSRPELKATFAGEVRLLRSINAIVIREMCAQVGRGL
ncbi:MAG: HipA domain-containing protein [Halopseudomonas sp.]|uniref:HipA domain-containing protein n=1 Tax=Halopseudomonas sp. TaxID=2901191 RepID=UPI003001C993